MKEILQNFNKAFESKVRLGIMSVLMVNDAVTFTELKELLNISDGNLASHVKALEEAQYIMVEKAFVGRKPQTTYLATQEGKKAFHNHLNALEEMIKDQLK